MHPIFEAVYVPAFIKAANANGRTFGSLEELGEALRAAQQEKVATVVLIGVDDMEKQAFIGGLIRGGRAAVRALRGGASPAQAAMGKATSALNQSGHTAQLAAQARPDIRQFMNQRVRVGSPEHKWLESQGGRFTMPTKTPGAMPQQASLPMMDPAKLQAAMAGGARAPRLAQAAKAQAERSIRLRQQARQAQGSAEQVGHNMGAGIRRGAGQMADAGGRLAIRGKDMLARGAAGVHEYGGGALDAGGRMLRNPAGAAALGGGVVLGGQAMFGGKQASLREKIARLKVAARVINADVGLDQIINHMKNARAKRVLAQSPAGA